MLRCQTCLLRINRRTEACPRCGSAHLEHQPVSIRERKIASILFADIRGSLQLIRGRDPEEASEIIDPIVSAMVEGTRRHGGTLVQIRGDGVHSVFGAPISQEDHARRACTAALWMQQRIEALAAEMHDRYKIIVSIRIGIHSGEVLFRATRNGDQTVLEVTGDTAYIAARMEQIAKPGTIQITQSTRRLAGLLTSSRSLGLRRVKGLQRTDRDV